MVDDILMHHGIKGMHWGVRRFQNYDGSLTKAGQDRYIKKISQNDISKNSDGSYTVPAGHKFYRVGGESVDFNQSGGLYMSDAGTDDVQRYIKQLGPTPLGKLLKTASYNVQNVSIKDDARMASEDQHNKIVLDRLSKDKKLFDTYNDAIYSMVVDDDDKLTQKECARLAQNPTSKKAKQIGYAVSSMFGDPAYSSETKKFYNDFRKNGFDILPDLHDTMSGTSESACICINPNKVEVTDRTYITKDIMRQGKEVVRQSLKLPVNSAIR